MKTKNKIDKKNKYKGNPRSISKKEYKLLKDHLEELGDLAGIVYCQNNKAYVGGNQRSEVFDGCKIEVVESYEEPTDHHTMALGFIHYNGEKYAYREVCFTKELFEKACIVANSDGGSFDWNILDSEWDTVSLTEWGLDTPGLEAKKVDDAVDDNFVVPDEVLTSITIGDLIEIGEHRLMCGDSTDQKTVSKLMNGELADMVLTDPPYNTGMSSKTNKGSTRLNHMFNDNYTEEAWQSLMSGYCEAYQTFTKEDVFLFICLDWRRSYQLIPHLKKNWKFSNLIVWDKVVHGLGSDYQYTHEFIHVCKKGKPKKARNKSGNKEYQDVWRIQRKMGKDKDHATKKPMELCSMPINHTTRTRDIVLDLFLGSGSTMIASHQLARRCYGMELDPKYCQIIIDRMIVLDDSLEVKVNGKQYIKPKVK